MATEKKRRSNAPSVICTIVGVIFLVAVIMACIPMVVPKIMGMQVYNVVTGSMEPTIPVGSLIIVEDTDPVDLTEGDIIAYSGGESVISHRVVENHVISGEVVTKGDANEVNDASPIPYDNIIGKVRWHIPIIGQYMSLLSSMMAKIYMIGVIVIGVLFIILGARLKVKKR